jgi:iron complex transport system substrate-binding protein
MIASHPQRIVCLTEETTETLYLLGEQERIVGISGYTVRPPRARREKPRVSAFISARIDKIVELKPDLVLGFSDLQADIAAELIRAGITVYVFNQRSVQEILNMMLTLGSLIGAETRARQLVDSLSAQLDQAAQAAAAMTQRPCVYFEEWDEPRISGIRWVAELINIAGGRDCFPELAAEPAARNRIITEDQQIIERQPDIIIGSWCGKRFRPDKVRERPGWDTIPAVRNGQLYEIKSAEILQPGPAALSAGLNRLQNIIQRWQNQNI